MNVNLPVLIACLIGLGASGAALAQQMGKPTPPADAPTFDEIDKNADGAITPDEARDNWLAKSFTEVDTNKDGRISQPEYEKATS